MSSPPPRKRVRQRASVANRTESSEMFDEVAPPATTATGTPTSTTTATAPGMPPGSSNTGSGSGSGSSRSRGRHRVQKTRNNAKNAAASTSNGHGTSNNEVTGSTGGTGNGSGGKNIDASCASDSSGSTSDLEDALGSPNESTTALIRKVRRKSDLSAFDQELMRIVGQHLHNIGLKTSADVLMAEAGTTLIHPTAANFKKMVLNGDWSLAVKSKFFPQPQLFVLTMIDFDFSAVVYPICGQTSAEVKSNTQNRCRGPT